MREASKFLADSRMEHTVTHTCFSNFTGDENEVPIVAIAGGDNMRKSCSPSCLAGSE